MDSSFVQSMEIPMVDSPLVAGVCGKAGFDGHHLLGHTVRWDIAQASYCAWMPEGIGNGENYGGGPIPRALLLNTTLKTLVLI
jgi:hypothetical protein